MWNFWTLHIFYTLRCKSQICFPSDLINSCSQQNDVRNSSTCEAAAEETDDNQLAFLCATSTAKGDIEYRKTGSKLLKCPSNSEFLFTFSFVFSLQSWTFECIGVGRINDDNLWGLKDSEYPEISAEFLSNARRQFAPFSLIVLAGEIWNLFSSSKFRRRIIFSTNLSWSNNMRWFSALGVSSTPEKSAHFRYRSSRISLCAFFFLKRAQKWSWPRWKGAKTTAKTARATREQCVVEQNRWTNENKDRNRR